MSLPIILSSVIFIVVFILIITERTHRTVTALFGAITVIILGSVFHFYSPEQAFDSIDFNTIGLLLGMMTIVVVLEETGFLEFLAIISAKKAKGNPWLLVVILGTVTTVVSFILDNVTTVIIIVPITILIAKITKISATPLLMAEALLSDTGGVATLVGDPPNVMIGSAAGFSFIDFITHVAPIVIVAWVATLITLKFVYAKELSKRPENIDDLLNWDASKSIKHKANIVKTLAVLAVVIVLFMIHDKLGIEPSFVALFGAISVLALVSIDKDPQPILQKLEWSVLAFFAALFVLVGSLEYSGAIKKLTMLLFSGGNTNLLPMALMLFWISAFASAIIDNIPFTVAMIPVLLEFQKMTGLNIHILWWSLALGVGFGGNGTPIGSTANVVVVSKSEETDEPITFIKWFKSGTIATLVTGAVATVSILVFYKYLSG